MNREPLELSVPLRWTERSPGLLSTVLGPTLRRLTCAVWDGALTVLVAEEPIGWHLSISHVDKAGKHRRYPTWDEIADARDQLLPADLDVVMWLPKAGDYVAIHPTTFHLHEHPSREQP